MENRQQPLLLFNTGDPLGQWHLSPVEWNELTLWDVADYVNGRAFRPTDFSKAGLKVIKITELKYGLSEATAHYDGSFEQKHLLRDGDLLFAWSGNPETSLDCHCWRGGSALLNQHIFRVLPRAGISKEYLYYLLKFMRPTFIRTARDKATSMGHVKVSDLKRLIVRVPTPGEQHAIAKVLGALDDKIELNRQMNETLEAMVRAIFKSWFVDFDPVRAKGEGRDPGLPKQIADLFPDRFDDSELGEIPAGWSSTKWGALVSLEYGKSLVGYDGENGQYPVYGTNGRIGSYSVPLCNHPGIIIGRKGAYRGVHYCGKPFYVIDTAFYVEPKNGTELRWAYYELLRQDINAMDSGSAIPSTSREDFYSLPVLSPPAEVQGAFANYLAPFWSQQELNNSQSRTLAALRDMLLPKLISGELRVEAADTLLETQL